MKKRKIILLLLCILFIFPLFCGNYRAFADDSVYLGGVPAGFSVNEDGARVVGISDVLTENGFTSPAKDSGIIIGDLILSIDGTPVFSAKDIENTVLNGEKKILSLNREGVIIIKDVFPALSVDGKYRLGVNIRDKITGIGTITFIKGNKFASLGHPITDESGKIAKINGGTLYEATVTGFIRGERYKAGELKGNILRNNKLGNITLNLTSGVYGEITENVSEINLPKITFGEGKMGKAKIYTTVNGKIPKGYDISIIKKDLDQENKNFVIRVEDNELLSLTGGILQGMSGSPIVQDGKLVGAVTHVFINDSKLGYGIAIENMSNNI